MADLKVSQLPSYPNILSGSNDAILIVDSTNNASRKISPQNLTNAFLFSGTIDPVATPIVTPAIYQNTTTETTWIFDGITWRQISGGGSNDYFVPYMSFTSSSTPSAGQIFTSSIFSHYLESSDLTVSVNGVVLSPVISYTLSDVSLTILDYLDSESFIEIAAKTVPVNVSENDLVTQSNDFIVTQSTDILILN